MSENQKVKVLSSNFVHCPRDDLIILIARMLNSLISINDNFNDSNLSSANLTRFHSRTPPGISVYSYLARLARYSSLENAVLLTAVYYIDLLSTIYSSFTLNSLTVHRFLLTATTVGSKGLCDSFCTNSHYAKVGGIQANELDILEREFLTKVNYRILPRDYNIENCANDNKVVSASERKKSIDQLEGGIRIDNPAQQQQQQQEEDNNQLNEANNKENYDDKNAGYNILDLYYRKMIALVGKEVNIDDQQLPECYEYRIQDSKGGGAEDKEEEVQSAEVQYETKNLIKTDPDTLPDEIYYKMIDNMMNAFREHTRNLKRKQHPGVSQCKKSSMMTDSSPTSNGHHNNNNNNNNNSTNSYNSKKIPKSPMKRTIENDPNNIPRGKRSSTTNS